MKESKSKATVIRMIYRLMKNEHLFVCSLSLEKCLLGSFVHFHLGLFGFVFHLFFETGCCYAAQAASGVLELQPLAHHFWLALSLCSFSTLPCFFPLARAHRTPGCHAADAGGCIVPARVQTVEI